MISQFDLYLTRNAKTFQIIRIPIHKITYNVLIIARYLGYIFFNFQYFGGKVKVTIRN